MNKYTKILLSLAFFVFFTNSVFAQTTDTEFYDSCLVGREIKELRDVMDTTKVAILYFGVNPQNRKDMREIKKLFKKGVNAMDIADLAVKDNQLNMLYIKNLYVLNEKEKNELYSIITSKTGDKEGPRTTAFCYEPNHALVFLDKNDEIKFEIEICFKCLMAVMPLSNFPLDNFCRESWNNLEKFILERNPEIDK
ncbi:hypothetical protein WAF17_09345 [Bernardetia sp. ABR2-2B]|uniref:hypothetical protein n=1 Tax=Bernardetia sp. ABR2-2B TaxID=3127472 RepID=UPI0030D4FF2D